MAMTLLTTNTSDDSSAYSDFTSSIDSTYKLYIFSFINIRSDTDVRYFAFQANATDTADYDDILMTSTAFRAYHKEDGSQNGISQMTASDQANAAGFQQLAASCGNASDESLSGNLWLFNPAGTTYAKHWYSRVQSYDHDDVSTDHWMSGYFNDATAIDNIRFKFTADNIADVVIKMYGVA